jgi:hypothetical protein
MSLKLLLDDVRDSIIALLLDGAKTIHVDVIDGRRNTEAGGGQSGDHARVTHD